MVFSPINSIVDVKVSINQIKIKFGTANVVIQFSYFRNPETLTLINN